MPYYAAACALGLAAGIAFAWLWMKAVPPGTNARYWGAMSALARDMLRVEATAEFLRLYRRLAVLTGGYLARNLGGTLLGCLPLLAILFAAAPVLFERPGAPQNELGELNPLKPMVGDVEALFLAAFVLSTLVGLLWPTLRKRI